MGRVVLGEGVMAILESISESYGEVELAPENAEQIFGEAKQVRVKDLTTTQLLQYSLVHAHIQNSRLHGLLEKLTATPNRASRRAAKKSGLILPS